MGFSSLPRTGQLKRDAIIVGKSNTTTYRISSSMSGQCTTGVNNFKQLGFVLL
jgi:hypothetical protein